MQTSFGRYIIHLDMDAYFASIEQRDSPIYRGKPIIICHSEDLPAWRGVVSTASYEARAFGVRSGNSVWEAKTRCPKGIFIPGNYAKYLYNTRQIVDICRRLSDLVEVFSIDEVFIDITPTWRRFGSPIEAAKLVKDSINKEMRLPVSVGIGPNKLVAKMASDLQKPQGLTIVSQNDLPGILAPLPVDSLFGVGRRVGRYLKSIGITTIGELAACPPEKLKSRFGQVMGAALHCAALGIDSSPVIPSGADDLVKSFGHSSSLGKGTSDTETLNRVLLGLTESVTRRMRQQGYLGRTVTLRLGLDRLLFFTRSRTISFSTNQTEPFVETGQALMSKEEESIRRYPVTLIGISISNLIDTARAYQLSLFAVNGDKQAIIAEAVDSIKDKYGEDCISRGSLMGWRRQFQHAPRIEVSRPRLR